MENSQKPQKLNLANNSKLKKTFLIIINKDYFGAQNREYMSEIMYAK